MGWAIKRANGTYRSWYRTSQSDESLAIGETWQELSACPTITPDSLTAAEQAADALNAVAVKQITTTVVWTLRRLLGRTPTSAEIQSARDEWIAVWKALP